MSGINRYSAISESIAGQLKRRDNLGLLIEESARPPATKPCVFLSHKSEDKAAVNRIAQYFDAAGIDYYLDINDPRLQAAVHSRNDALITQFIELGIRNSTHLLTIISEKTRESWWVPFEIGYGKRDSVHLAHLPLRNVIGILPSFLAITEKIAGVSDLNAYIKKVARQRYAAAPAGRKTLQLLREEQQLQQTLDPYYQTNPLRHYLKQ